MIPFLLFKSVILRIYVPNLVDLAINDLERFYRSRTKSQ